MGSLDAICVGLKDRLVAISGLNAYDEAPGVVVVPAAFPVPGPIEYDETMDSDVTTYNLRIRLLVQLSTRAASQKALNPYLAPSGDFSVRAAVNGDQTLGGVADWTRVVGVARYGDIEHGGISYLGAELDVEVGADGA